jgi:beta-carotene ketolase (CrtW type)
MGANLRCKDKAHAAAVGLKPKRSGLGYKAIMHASVQALPHHLRPAPARGAGVWVAVSIMLLWSGAMVIGVQMPVDYFNPLTYVLVLVATHLYTGLFITAHDAMHGLVSANKKTNKAIGTAAALLFAYNWYPRLLKNHIKHHSQPGTAADPDWHPGNFLQWYFSFARHYVTWWQIVAMAITYNVLKIWFERESLIVFWELPALLSTLQLFFFGTYLPHKGHHAPEDPHKAVSQDPNHVWAFVSCYNFGYHYEHHAMPWLPWYKLPAARVYNAHAAPSHHALQDAD